MSSNLPHSVRGLLVGLCAITVAGCATVHKVNPAPESAVSALSSFSIESDGPIANSPWWQSFHRAALDSLVRQSLADNFDLAQAVAVLAQTQSEATRSGALNRPQIGLAGSASQAWRDSERQRGESGISANLSWEIDVWNRLASAAKADQLEAEARLADIQAVKLSLSAEVSNAYFAAVAARERIALLKQQLNLDKNLEQILQLRFDSGLGTQVDVLQQRARVADSETLVPLAESTLAVFENRLDVLLGQSPDGKPRVPVNDSLDFASAMPNIGVPAELLLNRPDLLAARAELVAADADIGAAIADRLPRITLDGSIGLSDGAAFSGPVSLIMGGFVQPMLDWGQRKAEVERNRALYEERLAAFTQLYLEAVEAVENALIQESKQREFLSKLGTQGDLLRQAANAAELRYKQGVDDYQPVISALRELRDVERDLVSEKLNLINIRIDLYRAIGGPIDEI